MNNEEYENKQECEVTLELNKLNLDKENDKILIKEEVVNDDDNNAELLEDIYKSNGEGEDDIDVELLEDICKSDVQDDDIDIELPEYIYKSDVEDDIVAELLKDIYESDKDSDQSEPFLKRLPTLFINNILSSETVHLSDNKTCLKFKNLKFIFAIIRGIVVNVFIKETKTTIWVDDNTGVIRCIVESNTPSDIFKQEFIQTIQTNKGAVESDSDDELLKASSIMENAILDTIQCLPDYLGFQEGDMVQITGKFKDYDNKRMCFVTNIMKISSTDVKHFIVFLKDMRRFHEALEDINDESF